MKAIDFFNKSRILVFIASLAGGICIIFLLGREFDSSIYIPTTARVIYVPVYFWLFYMAYFLITYLLFLKKTFRFPFMSGKVFFGHFFCIFI